MMVPCYRIIRLVYPLRGMYLWSNSEFSRISKSFLLVLFYFQWITTYLFKKNQLELGLGGGCVWELTSHLGEGVLHHKYRKSVLRPRTPLLEWKISAKCSRFDKCAFSPLHLGKKKKNNLKIFPLISGNACIECAGIFLWVIKPTVL